MMRIVSFLVALFISSGAVAQSTSYPAGAIPFTASASGTTAAVTATITAVANKTAVICGFYYAGSNATAAQSGVVTITGITGGTMSYAFPTLALGATVPNTVPIDEAFLPCIPATGTNTAIAVAGPALGSGAPVATVTVWGYYQ